MQPTNIALVKPAATFGAIQGGMTFKRVDGSAVFMKTSYVEERHGDNVNAVRMDNGDMVMFDDTEKVMLEEVIETVPVSELPLGSYCIWNGIFHKKVDHKNVGKATERNILACIDDDRKELTGTCPVIPVYSITLEVGTVDTKVSI